MLSGFFLSLAVVAFLAAVVAAAGCASGIWSWRKLWAFVGMAGGLCVFGLFQAVDPSVPVLVPPLAFLFAGSGMAAAFGTLYFDRVRGKLSPPELRTGNAEALILAQDRVDALRPGRPQWLVTLSLAVLAVGLVVMGTTEVFELVPTAFGLVGVAGVVAAARRLVREQRLADRLEDELVLVTGEARDRGPESGP